MASNDNALHRLTYDWLIRFVELHRIDTDFIKHQLRTSRYGPTESPYSKISPLFTDLVKRYMPMILNPHSAEFRKDKLRLKEYEDDKVEMPLPTDDRKPVLISKCITLEKVKAGTLTKYIESRVFCINSYLTHVQHSHVTPTELEYLIKQSMGDLLLLDSFLTEPVNFSDIWPLLKRVPVIALRVKNLVIDDNITHALRYRPWEVRTSILHIFDCDVSERKIMEIIECLLGFPTFPASFQWSLKRRWKNTNLQPIADKIKARMTAAGYVWDKTNGDATGVTIVMFGDLKMLIVSAIQKIFHVAVLPRLELLMKNNALW